MGRTSSCPPPIRSHGRVIAASLPPGSSLFFFSSRRWITTSAIPRDASLWSDSKGLVVDQTGSVTMLGTNRVLAPHSYA